MAANIYDPAFPDHDVVRRLDVGDEVRSTEASREAGALQTAIFNSVNFSSIATDAQGVIQIFNVGAERMLGYRAADAAGSALLYGRSVISASKTSTMPMI